MATPLPETGIVANVTTGEVADTMEAYRRLNRPRGPRIYVAANDAPSWAKDAAGRDGTTTYICDGTADDVQIQLAHDDLPANGGEIVLTEGTFNLATFPRIEKDNVTLSGAGAGQRTGATQTGVGTKLQVVSGFTGTQALRVQRAADDRPVYGVLLRDFTIDGGVIGAGVDGILYRSNRGLIHHVHVHRATGNGFHLLGYATWDLYDTALLTVQAGDNSAAGVLFDSFSTDGHLGAHSVIYNNQDSIVIKAGSLQISDSHLYDATRYNIFFDGGGSRTKIEACKIEGAGQHGINIDSTNGGYSSIQIIGCGISTNGDLTNNTYDNIIIQGPSGNGVGRTMIVGNAIGVKSGTANEARYGVNLASTAAQNTYVFGNAFDVAAQFGTAAVNNAGSTSLPAIIRHNMNWVTEASGTVAVGAASTTATVTHGLSVTPVAKDVRLNFSADPLASNKLWASGFTSTQFTVNVGTAPGGAGTTVAWEVQVL